MERSDEYDRYSWSSVGWGVVVDTARVSAFSDDPSQFLASLDGFMRYTVDHSGIIYYVDWLVKLRAFETLVPSFLAPRQSMTSGALEHLSSREPRANAFTVERSWLVPFYERIWNFRPKDVAPENEIRYYIMALGVMTDDLERDVKSKEAACRRYIERIRPSVLAERGLGREEG